MVDVNYSGWIKYSDKICQHWPEFAQNGKENITIEDLMKHEVNTKILQST